MKCMKCKVNNANVYITTNINGNVKKECLCEECAKNVDMQKFMNMDKMLSRMFGSNNRLSMFDMSMPRTTNDFFERERILFEDMINDMKQINHVFENMENKRIVKAEPEDTVRMSKGKNVIKKPMQNKEDSIEDLKKKLEIAIKEERYEDAAVLRDKINGKNK